MTDEQDKKAQKEKLKSDEKQARLAEALRTNLRRRKQQVRERKTRTKDTPRQQAPKSE